MNGPIATDPPRAIRCPSSQRDWRPGRRSGRGRGLHHRRGARLESQSPGRRIRGSSHRGTGGADDEDLRQCRREVGRLCAVNHAGDYLGFDRVAMGTRRGPHSPCRIAAISGMPEFDADAELPVALEAALNESIVRNALTVFPGETDPQRQGTLAHRRLCRMMAVGRAISAPLCACGRPGRWGVDLPGVGRCRTRSVAAPLRGVFLTASRRVSGGVAESGAQPGPAAMATAVASVAFARAGAGLWSVAGGDRGDAAPLPYTVSVDCEIQPATRRYVAAPHAGIFARSFVKAGDVVHREQL